ncbi:MAG: hypothetical protein LBP32_07135 [Spirochaetaceae bacterium]|jgi:outer membrane protein assembly factor BamA|nr:hypothetical protein [Spirochaetaceae bacterium]
MKNALHRGWGVFLLFLTAAAGAPAQELGPITGFSVSGLKRTKPHVAEQPLRQFLGREASLVDPNDVRAAVMDTGILEPISVEIVDAGDGSGKILAVLVREKWSIFPLPMFFIGSGGMSLGGFFIDSNAFGLNDKMILGGMYSSKSWMVMTMYINTPDRAGFFGWNIGGFYSREERTDTDQKNRAVRRFNLDSINASAGINYPLSDILTPSLNFSFYDRILRETGDPLEAPETGAMALGVSPGISLRKTDWDGYLLSRQSISLEYTYTIGIRYPSSHSASILAAYERSLIPGFKAGLRTGIVYAPRAASLFESPPSSVQIDILPRSFSARNYAGASADVEKYLFQFSFGTLSALLSYQIVWSEGPLLGSRFDHGVMGAVRFYLSRLAIPALGFGMAYNVAARYFQCSFNIGISL